MVLLPIPFSVSILTHYIEDWPWKETKCIVLCNLYTPLCLVWEITRGLIIKSYSAWTPAVCHPSSRNPMSITLLRTTLAPNIHKQFRGQLWHLRCAEHQQREDPHHQSVIILSNGIPGRHGNALVWISSGSSVNRLGIVRMVSITIRINLDHTQRPLGQGVG